MPLLVLCGGCGVTLSIEEQAAIGSDALRAVDASIPNKDSAHGVLLVMLAVQCACVGKVRLLWAPHNRQAPSGAIPTYVRSEDTSSRQDGDSWYLGEF